MSGAVNRPGGLGRPGLRLLREQGVLARIRGTEDKIADAITAFAGTMLFVYLHALWLRSGSCSTRVRSARRRSGIPFPSDCSP